MSTEPLRDNLKRNRNSSLRIELKWAGFTAAIAFFALVASPDAAHVSHPATSFTEWYFVTCLGVVGIMVGLYSSAKHAARWLVRCVLAVCMVVSLIALSIPLRSCFETRGDIPWNVALPILTMIIIGSWIGRQRWLTFCLVGLVLSFWYSAYRPPLIQKLPITRHVGDLTVTLDSIRREGWLVRSWFTVGVVGGDPGKPIPRLRGVDVGQRCCMGLQLPQSVTSSFTDENEGQWTKVDSGAEVPRWSHSFDVVFFVERWPGKPMASLELPIPMDNSTVARSFDAFRVHYEISLVNAQNPKSVGIADFSNRPRVINISMRAVGKERPEFANDIQAKDNRNRVLQLYWNNVRGENEEIEARGTVESVKSDARSITLEIFRQDDLEVSKTKFEFDRLPNPKDRETLGTTPVLNKL